MREAAPRHAMLKAERQFERRFDELVRLFAFTAEQCAAQACAPSVALVVDFVLEELFTNVVKYAHGQGAITVGMLPVAGGFEVTFEEPDAEPFDPTRSPDPDLDAPLEERPVGGLGLYLIRRQVDAIDYEYLPAQRLGRVRFRKVASAQPAEAS